MAKMNFLASHGNITQIGNKIVTYLTNINNVNVFCCPVTILNFGVRWRSDLNFSGHWPLAKAANKLV